ncbi:hypothetical protein KKE78_00055 [Patescibacteria group bacterium]|nr:hypothetical protein [Patescibacteria group bacterium]
MNEKKLFGTSGIRGDAKKDFTNQFCFDIACSFPKFLDNHNQKGPIAIGKDPRSSTPRIAKAVTDGLFFSEKKVFDQGICPVPAINSILKTSEMTAGIMITGSHIDAELNGLKFFSFKEEILKEHEAEIEEIYFKLKEKVKFKSFVKEPIDENRANEGYAEMLLSFAQKPYPKWKVVLDCSNGCQSVVMPELLNNLGFEVVVINNNIHGKFIARDTEAQGAVEALSKMVVKTQANLGIGFDPDGDRVVFVDESGNFIPGDVSGSLIAKYEDVGNIIITPINTSQVVEALGKPVIRTRVGSPFVVKAMKDNNASFGFEANGGGIFAKGVMSRDGGTTTITLLNILSRERKSLKELVSLLPKFYLHRLKVDCPTSLNEKILLAAEKEYKATRIEKLDGLKLWLDKTTWILFRPSNNAPEFRVFVEAETSQKAEEQATLGIAFVKKIMKGENI